MIRRVLLLACLLALSAPAGAAADPYLPAGGRVWHGVTSGSAVGPFQAAVAKHPAVWQHFIQWGGAYGYAIDASRAAGTRPMFHISTAKGQNLGERFSPGALARGAGDGWLVGFTRSIAAVGAPVYVRLFGEMNNCNNAYAAYSCGAGGRRDAAHAPAELVRAWKRAYLILHGGDVAAIDARLAQLGMPPLAAPAAVLPRPRVALVWAPMTGGSPEIPALRPEAYWPGRAWVDWVGTSFYSRFPNWGRLDHYYRTFAVGRRKPFAIAEWAIWGADDPAFARRLFGWVRDHPRVRMLQYNQGSFAASPFAIARHPASMRAMRRALRSPRFVAYAPEFG